MNVIDDDETCVMCEGTGIFEDLARAIEIIDISGSADPSMLSTVCACCNGKGRVRREN